MMRALPSKLRDSTRPRLGSFSVPTSTRRTRSFSSASYTAEEQKQHVLKAMPAFTFEVTPAGARKNLVTPEIKASIESLKTANQPMPPVFITKLPGHPHQDTIDTVELVKSLGYCELQ